MEHHLLATLCHNVHRSSDIDDFSYVVPVHESVLITVAETELVPAVASASCLHSRLLGSQNRSGKSVQRNRSPAVVSRSWPMADVEGVVASKRDLLGLNSPLTLPQDREAATACLSGDVLALAGDVLALGHDVLALEHRLSFSSPHAALDSQERYCPTLYPDAVDSPSIDGRPSHR